ncbi:MAG: hypothetical protein IPH39_16505 [Sulfuritalea sp.]|mgnify:CR=1 FL=1|jgi:hypothetical protein|nr:hypothetical protein [Sulfuritalea sp.]MBK8762276.1 hypothetical protein [Sulfuritalea sp.]MBK9348788.1 hypothetical protein [Sulfuritalea sp.]MBP7422883.1 hypothetical protein [Sulfuritalea sp.]
MKINDIENVARDLVSRQLNQERPPEIPRETQAKDAQAAIKVENKPPSRPVQPPPKLIAHVSQSLTGSQQSPDGATGVPGIVAAEQTATANDLERSQFDKQAEALQAFAHALIQAANEPRASAVTGGEQASSSAGRSSEPPANTDRTSSISAYEGLVSRLESLVREIEGSAEPGGTSPELERLRNSFRDVSQARTESGSATPDLQTYMKTLVRNLQSTGDPTLASTGNVINTAA